MSLSCSVKGADEEMQLLLLVLRRFLGTSYDQNFSLDDSIYHNIDWGKFVRLVVRHGLAGFVYLQNKNDTFLPEGSAERLKECYRSAGISNLLQFAELIKIIKVLDAEGVDVVPLKGVLDAQEIFGNLAVYPSSDIDLLVQESKLTHLPDVLNRLGYNPIETIAESDLLASHYHLIYRKNAFLIEIHWNLVKRYFQVPAEFWWDGVQKRNCDGIEASRLSAEKYLLYLMFRLFDHQFSPLKFWVHFGGVVQNCKNVDWDKLLESARYIGMERLALFSLCVVHDLLGISVPAAVIEGRSLAYGIVKNLVVWHSMNESKYPHLIMAIFALYLLPPLVATRVFLSMLFPPSSEIRLRYQLPLSSKRVYLHKILNPILMIFRRK